MHHHLRGDVHHRFLGRVMASSRIDTPRLKRTDRVKSILADDNLQGSKVTQQQVRTCNDNYSEDYAG